MLVAEHPDDPDRRVFASVKCNVAAKPPSLGFHFTEDGFFAWEQGTVDISANDLIAAQASKDKDQGAVAEAVQFLEQMLEHDGKRVAEKVTTIRTEAEKVGVSMASVNRAKRKLGLRVQHVSVQGGKRGDGYWVWRYLTNEEVQESDHLEQNSAMNADGTTSFKVINQGDRGHVDHLKADQDFPANADGKAKRQDIQSSVQGDHVSDQGAQVLEEVDHLEQPHGYGLEGVKYVQGGQDDQAHVRYDGSPNLTPPSKSCIKCGPTNWIWDETCIEPSWACGTCEPGLV